MKHLLLGTIVLSLLLTSGVAYAQTYSTSDGSGAAPSIFNVNQTSTGYYFKDLNGLRYPTTVISGQDASGWGHIPEPGIGGGTYYYLNTNFSSSLILTPFSGTGNSGIGLFGISATSGPQTALNEYLAFSARGSVQNPLPPLAGDEIAAFGAGGWHGPNVMWAAPAFEIDPYASSDWSDTNGGVNTRIEMTKEGAIGRRGVQYWHNGGTLNIGSFDRFDNNFPTGPFLGLQDTVTPLGNSRSDVAFIGSVNGQLLAKPALGAASKITLSDSQYSGQPNFSATISGNQTLVAGEWTKVHLDSETFDSAGYYDTGNYRFTPHIAGNYRITFAVYLTSSGFSQGGIAVYKNGAPLRYAFIPGPGTPLITATIYFNGTTDYVEGYAYINQGVPPLVNAGSAFTWLDGTYVGP